MTSGSEERQAKKRSGSETRQRGPIIGFRASPDELSHIKAAADRQGLTVSSYVRSRALEKPTTRAVRRPPVATAQLAQLLGLLGAAGGTLQHLEQRVEADSPARSEILEAIADFREATSAILRTLGKRT